MLSEASLSSCNSDGGIGIACSARDDNLRSEFAPGCRLIFCGDCADRQRVTAPSSALSPGEDKPAPKPGTQFVARQPILTADEKVFGYELLFRDGVEDFFKNPDQDAASRSTLNTSMLLGLDVLCDGHRAFINCTRDVLLKDYITLLPSEQAVVEILETVPADDLVVDTRSRWTTSGSTIRAKP